MISYAKKFIANLPSITESLTKLPLKETHWHWEERRNQVVKGTRHYWAQELV